MGLLKAPKLFKVASEELAIKTMEEVASELGISRQRVAYLEASGLRKLRNAFEQLGYSDRPSDFKIRDR